MTLAETGSRLVPCSWQATRTRWRVVERTVADPACSQQRARKPVALRVSVNGRRSSIGRGGVVQLPSSSGAFILFRIAALT